jgi:hypothetical protein
LIAKNGGQPFHVKTGKSIRLTTAPSFGLTVAGQFWVGQGAGFFLTRSSPALL